MSMYLLPKCTNGDNLILEYELIEVKKDMRCTFCKVNKNYEIDSFNFFITISTLRNTNNCIKFKGNRLIITFGKVAYEFQGLMKDIYIKGE